MKWPPGTHDIAPGCLHRERREKRGQLRIGQSSSHIHHLCLFPFIRKKILSPAHIPELYFLKRESETDILNQGREAMQLDPADSASSIYTLSGFTRVGCGSVDPKAMLLKEAENLCEMKTQAT